jgi:HEAT repeat protein
LKVVHMPSKHKKSSPTFKEVTAALLDNNRPFSPRFLHLFSDISPSDLDELKRIWLQINLDRRVALLEDLEELAESDTVVSFDDVAHFALSDPDARIRATALRLMWENDDVKLVPEFTRMMFGDKEEVVRAQAATSLGLFVYIGELEAVPSFSHHKIEDDLLMVLNGTDSPIVRRRALESLGFSSRMEVPPLIQKAIHEGDPQWLASALFAMGRSADEQWEDSILQYLDHPDPDVQVEAIRAAGQLELASAREILLTKIQETDEPDVDLRAAAVWSLSQIGGEGVREALDELFDVTEDEDESDYIEEALNNLSFTDGVADLGMLGFPTDAEDRLNTIIDVSDIDGDEESGNHKHKKKKTG